MLFLVLFVARQFSSTESVIQCSSYTLVGTTVVVEAPQIGSAD